MKFYRAAWLFLFVAAIVAPSGLRAQSAQGRISGQVTDPSSASVPDATVTIENLGTHVKRVLVTNQDGTYVAPGIEPGLYSLTVEAKSFRKVIRGKIQIEVGNDVKIDFSLVPGGVTEVIEVTDDAPLTETSNAVLNGVLSNKAINELPLQGRDFQNLLALHPGVQRTPGGGFHSVTSNGGRPDDNNFIIDGANDNDAYYGETVINDAGVSGTPASHLPLDAIQEFNTQESPQADYGIKPGVVVNIGLKGGSNQLHGTGYYFHRNAALDGRNYFNPKPDPLGALLMHQFGASVGGPIVKDKLFYFAAYEGTRHKVGNPFAAASPITAPLGSPNCMLDPANDIDNSDLCLAAARQDILNNGGTINPLSDHLAGLFLPNNGGGFSADQPELINFSFNNLNREDNVVAKGDYHPNSQNTFSARWIYGNSLQNEEDAIPLRPEWLSQADTHSQVFGVDWTWTPNSRWVNAARFSLNRYWQKINPIDHTLDPAQAYGINTGVSNPDLLGFPRISISPFEYMGGNSSWPLYTTPSHAESFSDDVSWTSGRHTLRFGAQFNHGAVNYLRGNVGRGRVDFRSLEDFLTGNVRRGQIQVGDLKRNVHMNSFGFFVQDDFRLRRRVTLNLGLRYDVALPIKEENNLIANFLPDRGLVRVGDGIDAPYDTKWNNVSPRVGVAWDVFGTGKTVIRAGGGVIFTQPVIRTFVNSGGLNLNPAPGINTFIQVLGSSDINWDSAGPVFPSAVGTPECTVDSVCDVFGVDQHLRTPYVANWTLGIQQALTPTMVLQAAYVGNRGIKLYSNKDINQTAQAPATQCIIDSGFSDYTGCEQQFRPFTTNCALGNGSPCFPNLEFVTFLGNEASSNYNSLQVTLTKRYGRGLYLLAGYTYGHAIDNATSNLAFVTQDSLNYQADRGNGDYDIRHRFTLSATYDVPGRKAPLQLLEGWQLTTILTLEGGEPFTVTDGFNDLSSTGETLDRWNFSGDPGKIKMGRPGEGIPFFPDGTTNPACAAKASAEQLSFYGCFAVGDTVIVPQEQGQFGNMGRNIFRGPAFKNWDFSVSKLWKLSERLKLQLRGEFFNVVNHPNFDLFTVSTDPSDGAAMGVFKATPDEGVANPVIGSGGSRHIQLGLKLVW